MKLSISERLRCCASLVPPGSRVADVGADHGYLGIYLLENGLASHVIASDLRPKPLQKARHNAERFGVAGRMEFLLSDGLAAVEPGSADTIVCAGMGGDLIRLILQAAPWVRERDCALVLQPQSAGQDLRRYLTRNGWRLERETLARDGGFLYNVLLARAGESLPLTPGEQYAPPQLLESGCPLVPEYLEHIEKALQKTLDSLQKAAEPQPEKLDYYRQALREITEKRRLYGNRA
jgi:tRNA (adenine22-N1)-methyltransferase